MRRLNGRPVRRLRYDAEGPGNHRKIIIRSLLAIYHGRVFSTRQRRHYRNATGRWYCRNPLCIARFKRRASTAAARKDSPPEADFGLGFHFRIDNPRISVSTLQVTEQP